MYYASISFIIQIIPRRRRRRNWGSQSSGYEKSYLLGYNPMQAGESQPLDFHQTTWCISLKTKLYRPRRVCYKQISQV
jgi:hypothetical protein